MTSIPSPTSTTFPNISTTPTSPTIYPTTTAFFPLDSVALHPLLRYHQFPDQHGNYQPMIWDLREDPVTTARPADAPERPFGMEVGSQMLERATEPPLKELKIHCGVFPEPWPMVACISPSSTSSDLAMHDILSTIYNTLQRRINHQEWNQLCEKQRMRISDVFHTRCRASVNPEATKAQGVLRMDCLLEHTLFGGLTMAVDGPYCILTLKRRG